MRELFEDLTGRKCENCRYNNRSMFYDTCTRDDEKGEKCRDGKGLLPPGYEKPFRNRRSEQNKMITNADKIRKMSDDELNQFMSLVEVWKIYYSTTSCDMCVEDENTVIDCDGCRLNWLKSEIN